MIDESTRLAEDIGALELAREFAQALERLQTSHAELERRAARIEVDLARKVEELDGMHRRLAAVLRSLPCGVVVRDEHGAVVDVNTAACEILGASAERLRADATHPLLDETLADGCPRTHELPGGRRVVVASHSCEVTAADGTSFGTVQVVDDRTEQARLAERMRAGEVMAALGTMAAGVAHEIRNPLNGIKGFASLLERDPDQGERARRWCRMMIAAAAEADTIVEGMLSFGSPERVGSEPIDARELVDGAVRLAQQGGGEARITQRCELDAFRGDAIKLRQALRNLVVNAIEAQRDGGEDPRVDIQLTREDDDVVVRVGDAGPGVSEEIRSRIFDPFFSHHPGGTGLGLALVSTIVRMHEGSVRVSREPSSLGGAEFILRIPFQPASPA